MNYRFSLQVIALGALVLLGGCRAATALSYETCSYDSDCQRPSDRCITLVHASGGSSAQICSSSCTFGGAQCPVDRYGTIGSCVSFDGGSSFQCYQSCSPGSSLCEYGTVCTTETTSGGGLSTNICYPPGGVSPTAAAYAGCAGGMLCQSGTSCINVKDNTTVELCTITHCSSDANCPLDRRGGRGACVSLDGDSFGTCVERCNVGSDCTYPSAERCTTITHNGVSLPSPGVCLP